MQKHLVLAGLFALLPLSAADAAVYGGLDLVANSIDFKSTAPSLFAESLLGPTIHIGDHFSRFAVELGYGTVRHTFQQTDLRINRLTGDGLAYVPVGGFLNIVLTAGLSQANFGASDYTHQSYLKNGIIKQARVPATLLHGDQINWRGGAGLSFSFAGGYEFHVIGRYEPLTMSGLANSALSLNTGFNIDLN